MIYKIEFELIDETLFVTWHWRKSFRLLSRWHFSTDSFSFKGGRIRHFKRSKLKHSMGSFLFISKNIDLKETVKRQVYIRAIRELRDLEDGLTVTVQLHKTKTGEVIFIN